MENDDSLPQNILTFVTISPTPEMVEPIGVGSNVCGEYGCLINLKSAITKRLTYRIKLNNRLEYESYDDSLPQNVFNIRYYFTNARNGGTHWCR